MSLTQRVAELVGSLNPVQRAVAEGFVSILDRLNPPHIDTTSSSVALASNGFHVMIVHDAHREMRIDVRARGDGEITVSYGHEHEQFRSADTEAGRVWPFAGRDHVRTALTLVEYLLTGRIELDVWNRPLGIRTRSFWINDHGQRKLFLRGSTVGIHLGWSRMPKTYRFDYMTPGPP